MFSVHAHEETTKDFIKAFKDADAESMSKFFASEIEFAGDHKFLGLDEFIPKTVSVKKHDITSNYQKLFKRYGKEPWKKLVKKAEPSVVVSEDGKELKGLVEVGDVICNMHFKEAKGGEPGGFDEAEIFVFRKIDDEYKVVFHFADY